MLVTSKKTNIICHGKLIPNDIDSIASSLSAGSTIYPAPFGLTSERSV